jgi:hypothetical protein
MKVAGIFVCGTKGDPMISIQEVEAFAGRGLEQDRYGNNLGRYSGKPNQSDENKSVRQVTFITEDGIKRANESLGITNQYDPRDTRRNILLDGISSEQLNALLGKIFAIGPTQFRGFELCTPCGLPDSLTGKKGFQRAFKGHGGIRAEILKGGIIRWGAPVVLL